MLLCAGAVPNAHRGDDYTALKAASTGGYEKIVQMLIHASVDLKTDDGYYGTALVAASAAGHERVVQMLLDAAPDVHAQGGSYHVKAVRAAQSQGHTKVMDVLMAA